MENKKYAIVTLTIGEKYQNLFKKYSYDSFYKYSKNLNADLIIIENPLDDSEVARKRSPAWQKLLILSQEWASQYEQILWIDSDVVINTKNAKNIFNEVPAEKVGGVDAYKIPNEKDYLLGLNRLYKYWETNNINYLSNLSPYEYYLNRGIKTDEEIDQVLHTGVFICSPKFHKDIFLEIYSSNNPIEDSSGNYEMPNMSIKLIEDNLITWLDPKYNYCVNEIIASDYPELIEKNSLFKSRKLKKGINEIFLKGQFIHFAGCTKYMKYLKN